MKMITEEEDRFLIKGDPLVGTNKIALVQKLVRIKTREVMLILLITDTTAKPFDKIALNTQSGGHYH